MENFQWKWISLTCFILWCFLSLIWADDRFVASIHLTTLIRSLFLAGALVFLLRQKIIKWVWFLRGVIALAILESLLGFFQVVYQRALGLYWFGEPHLNLLDPTIAKTVVSGGGRLLRAYGTFPHPNVLGAFLLIGIFSFLSLRGVAEGDDEAISHAELSSADRSPRPALLVFAKRAGLAMTIVIMFTLFLGLLLTFSRSAWLVGIILLTIQAFARPLIALRRRYIFMIILITIVIVGIFHWAVFPKLSFSKTEPAIVLREKYLKIGWEILKQKPLLGVGVGNQVSYAIKNNLYQREGIIKKLDYQPVHNIYLLIADELGIIGLVLFLLFIISTFYNSIIHNSYFIIPILALLLLGLTDHYLWTLPDGRIMFWTVIFLASAYSSTDRAYPSEG